VAIQKLPAAAAKESFGGVVGFANMTSFGQA
jgi:hypothetical protein